MYRYHFWLQDLDLDVLYRHLYGPTKLPFRVTQLPFEVQVGALDQTLELRLYPHDGGAVNTAFASAMDEAIHQANEKSRKSKTYQGNIHNWSFSTEPGYAQYELDMGSANLKLLQLVLKQLAATRLLKKVVIGRLPPGTPNG